jgi:hypothetical protein
VTSSQTVLLSFISVATETNNGPVDAAVGTVTTMEVLLQNVTGKEAPFSNTRLPFCEAPKPVPVMAT